MDEEEIDRILKLPSMEKLNIRRKMEKKPLLTSSTPGIRVLSYQQL